MTKCLFCGAYCEVKCGTYCEGYPENPGKRDSNEAEETEKVLGCTQIGISYICDICLKDLKEALELINISGDETSA